jgi:hypothetical protein
MDIEFDEHDEATVHWTKWVSLKDLAVTLGTTSSDLVARYAALQGLWQQSVDTFQLSAETDYGICGLRTLEETLSVIRELEARGEDQQILVIDRWRVEVLAAHAKGYMRVTYDEVDWSQIPGFLGSYEQSPTKFVRGHRE